MLQVRVEEVIKTNILAQKKHSCHQGQNQEIRTLEIGWILFAKL